MPSGVEICDWPEESKRNKTVDVETIILIIISRGIPDGSERLR